MRNMAVGYVRTQGKYVYFDRTGLIIENSQKLHENVPEVTGLTLDKVTLYKNLTATDPDKLDTVIRVADLLNQEGLTPDEIRYSTKDELILIFGKLNVLMGDESSIEDKISVLSSILPTVADKSGNLNMESYSSQSQSVTYRDTPETETETGSPDGDGRERKCDRRKLRQFRQRGDPCHPGQRCSDLSGV